MAVRRLAPDEVQPASFAFTPDNAAWAEATVAKYPAGKQASAIIPLLFRAQEQEGWVSRACIEFMADKLGMNFIRVLEVATFYTMFQLAPVGRKAHVQVCGTTPCMLRGSDDLIAVCKSRIAPHQHELSADGDFSWEEVECLGACVNAPMVQVWSDCYEDLTVESFGAVLDAFARSEKPRPGPQSDRQGAEPDGGPVTLTDPGLYDGRYRVNIATTPPDDGEVAVASPPAPAPVAPPAAKPAQPEAKPAPAAEPVAAAKPAPAAAPVAASALVPAAAPAPIDEPPPPAAVKPLTAAERVADEHKPKLLNGPRAGKGDDLKLIWGVGPKLEVLLNKLGVWHFDQIAAWDEMNLRWVDQHLGAFRGRALRDKWIEQSIKLAAGWRPSADIGEKPR